ncbi:hypothetical protein H5T58_01135 [Candidatus Parcubacteria bacterium]|nr:hypothetical protein [Candidatus Parcubacteria bacterium]
MIKNKKILILVGILVVMAMIALVLIRGFFKEKQKEITRAKEIKFVVGEKQFFVDGKAKFMDAPAIIINEQVYVRAKYLAEAMGTVWNSKQGRVSLLFPDWGRAVELFVGKPAMRVCGEEIEIPVAPLVRERVRERERNILACQICGRGI